MSAAERQAIAVAAKQAGEVLPPFDFGAVPVASTVFARFSFSAKAVA